MNTMFFCPYCKGKLNVSNNVVFSAKTHDGRVGLIFLSKTLGDYHTKTHPSFKIKEGEVTEFYCPICHANLAALEFGENLVKVSMMDNNSTVYEVLFSGIAGEHCTYVLKDKDVQSYGENFHKYSNFFGENFDIHR